MLLIWFSIVCGFGILASALVNPALVSSPYGDYQYVACYSDNNASARALAHYYVPSPNTTVERCVTICEQNGYGYAGVEYGFQCFCGNTLDHGTGAIVSATCNMACNGNTTEACGGTAALNLYENNAVLESYTSAHPSATDNTVAASTVAPSTTTPGTGPPTAKATIYGNGYVYDYQGCFLDPGPPKRPLTHYEVVPYGANLTLENCISTCQSAGYGYAGAEDSAQCFCDNGFTHNTTVIAQSNCNMKCKGDPTEFCGGAGALSLYINDAVVAAADASSSASASSASAAASALSASAAAAKKSSDDASLASVSKASVASAASVRSEESVASVSRKSAAAASSHSKAASASSHTSVPPHSTSATPSHTVVTMHSPSHSSSAKTSPHASHMSTTATAKAPRYTYRYDGCFAYSTTKSPLSTHVSAHNNTLEYCGGLCSGAAYFGVVMGTQCYCGSSVGASPVAADMCFGSAAYACPGKTSETCGGFQGMAVYGRVADIGACPSSGSSAGAVGCSSVTAAGLSTTAAKIA